MMRFLPGAVVALLLWPGAGTAVVPALPNQEPPRILLDQSPRAVDYQLNRLTNDELVRVERKTTDPKVQAGLRRTPHAERAAAGDPRGGADGARRHGQGEPVAGAARHTVEDPGRRPRDRRQPLEVDVCPGAGGAAQ